MDIGITNRFLFWKFKRVEEFYVKKADVIIIYKLSGSSLFLEAQGVGIINFSALVPLFSLFYTFLL